MLFDSHAHVNFEAFNENWKDVIDDCQKKDIWLMNVGSQYETSQKAIDISGKYKERVYASVGIHPVHAHKVEFDEKKFRLMIESSKKVRALGETGIDFWHNATHFEIQKEVFIKHIRLAKEYNLGLIIHGRSDKDGKISCYEEILKIIKKEKVTRAVVHCYGGTSDEAKQFLDLGLFIGFTGIVTFKNAKELQEIAKNVVPLEQMLIETDCPYLAPDPFRGKENKPQYVEYVAKKISELKGVGFDTVASMTFENAKKLYGLDVGASNL